MSLYLDGKNTDWSGISHAFLLKTNTSSWEGVGTEMDCQIATRCRGSVIRCLFVVDRADSSPVLAKCLGLLKRGWSSNTIGPLSGNGLYSGTSIGGEPAAIVRLRAAALISAHKHLGCACANLQQPEMVFRSQY